MKTALLIINYNDAKTTEQLILNTKDYKCLDAILVLDNYSTDDSYTYLKERYREKHIQVRRSEGNYGYAYAINYGCKQLMEHFREDCNVIISNSDIVIYKESDIEKLITCKSEEMAIVAPVVKEAQGISRGWKLPTPMKDALCNIVFIHRFLTKWLLHYGENHYKGKKLVEVDVILGCFFLMDTKYLREVDYYDEETFLYYEENIMAKKLKDIGAKTIVNTEVEVFHNHSVSIDKAFGKLKKIKMLKETQYYFQTEYNKANAFERACLNGTRKASYHILKLIYNIRG